MLVLSNYDTLVKWSGLAITFALLSVLAACAEQGSFGGNFMSKRPVQPAASATAASAPTQNNVALNAPRLSVPQGLVGMSAQEISSAMGEPHLLRTDLNVQMWQYTDQNCVLLLYLYEDASKVYRVTHMESRAKNTAAPGSKAQCASLT